MRHFAVLIWVIFAVLGAVPLAFITGLIHPDEKVSGLWLVIGAVLAGALSMAWVA